MLYVQGGEDARYVSFPRISPGRLDVVKLGGIDFIACKDVLGGRSKVSCGLNLGCVESSNLLATEVDTTAKDERQPRKKYIRVTQVAGWSIREQSVICYALGLTETCPIVQMGWDDESWLPSSLEFSTKPLYNGLYFIIFCVYLSDHLAYLQSRQALWLCNIVSIYPKIATHSTLRLNLAGSASLEDPSFAFPFDKFLLTVYPVTTVDPTGGSYFA